MAAIDNLLDLVWPTSQLFDTGPPLWVSLHSQMAYVTGPFELVFALAVVIGVFQGFTVSQMMTLFVFDPKGLGVGLLGVYVAWVVVVVSVYSLCRWVATVKLRRTNWWLSYL